jgi:hypothetical protein
MMLPVIEPSPAADISSTIGPVCAVLKNGMM